MLRNLYKRVLVVIAFLVLTGIIYNRTSADELRLTTGEYPPFTTQNIPGGGIVSEIVELVIREMGYDFTVDYLPWKRGYVLSKKGTYAATYPYLLTEERVNEFHYSDPIIEWRSHVYVRRDSGIVYNSSLDLLGLRECLPHHYGGLPELDKLHAEGKIKRVRTPYIKSCWLMILNGRADFFVEDVFVADIFRREVLTERFDEIVELERTISTDYGYIIFPRGFDRSEKLVAQFNDTLADLSESGKILEIKETFLKEHTQIVDLIN
ncbi:substrate-binding periplasmic protein [Kiloniella litopenaei]|uniref:substrate-binding periplasmic protein n=1 Tax=Kiloniella litopenaei TaxID=1549748 RepID=UPI0006991ECB|nr:ABC transporter substrate-binding protein [Kiloniella litopenaei]